MKTQTTNLLKQISKTQLENLTHQVKETIATTILTTRKVFTPADLWKIQRHVRTAMQRRSFV